MFGEFLWKENGFYWQTLLYSAFLICFVWKIPQNVQKYVFKHFLLHCVKMVREFENTP